MSQAETTPISARTRYCAVYGHPIQHSASPAMQNAGMAALGLDWRYLAFDVHPESLRAAILGAQSMKFVGLNLTVPHKILALEMVDELDESARKWGAVNTIRFEARAGGDGWKPAAVIPAEQIEAVRSRGFNTDADAIIRAVLEDLGLSLAGKTVLLLGAGGAGRVAALRMAEEGVRELFLANRTEEKARQVAAEIGPLFPAVRAVPGYPRGPVDLIVNATSLGLRETDPLPLDESKYSVKEAGAVFDMIYRPAEPPLLQAAKAAGCRAANGLSMLLYQGAKALEIWTGQEPPVEVMRKALQLHVYGKSRET